MDPAEFSQAHSCLKKAPEDEREIRDLPVHYDPETFCLTSCWQLTEADLAEINRTGQLWVQMLCAGSPPPVLATAFSPFLPTGSDAPSNDR